MPKTSPILGKGLYLPGTPQAPEGYLPIHSRIPKSNLLHLIPLHDLRSRMGKLVLSTPSYAVMFSHPQRLIDAENRRENRSLIQGQLMQSSVPKFVLN